MIYMLLAAGKLAWDTNYKNGMVLDFLLNYSTHIVLCRERELVRLKCKLPGHFVCSFKELFVVLPVLSRSLLVEIIKVICRAWFAHFAYLLCCYGPLCLQGSTII